VIDRPPLTGRRGTNVPTVAESGYPDFETDTWIGLLAPAKTPKETVAQLANWFATALETPEIKRSSSTSGFLGLELVAPILRLTCAKQNDEYGRAIRKANIKGE
jgi:tripartite-type tricarboxylate transporter receptor subunit TctC